MLLRSENPALFLMVFGTLTQNDMLTNSTAYAISDEDLAKIEDLGGECDFITTTRGLKNLKGIEKLKNLKSLTIRGLQVEKESAQAEYDVMDEIYEIDDTSRGTEKIISGIMDKHHKEVGNRLMYNQLEDISDLKRCKNLETLLLDEQRLIETIDFSHNKNLKNIYLYNCRGLRQIKGLDTLDIDTKHDQINIDIVSATRLREIKNFGVFKDKILSMPAKNANVILPLNYYSIATNKYKNLLADEKFNRSKSFNWAETIEEYFTTSQVNALKNRVRNILRNIIGKDDGDVVKIASVYKYICENFEYDTKALYREQGAEKRLPTSYIIRSGLHTLERGKGVCVGFTRLFNFMLTELGMETDEVLCVASLLPTNGRIVESDHSIAKAYVQGLPYYFDPTWDMERTHFKYFMLNREEVQKENHFLDFYDEATYNSPSVQQMLKECEVDLVNRKSNTIDFNIDGTIDGEMSLDEIRQAFTPVTTPLLEDKTCQGSEIDASTSEITDNLLATDEELELIRDGLDSFKPLNKTIDFDDEEIEV